LFEADSPLICFKVRNIIDANVNDRKLLKMEIRSEKIRYSKGKSKELKITRKCYSRENRRIRLQNL